MANKSICPDCGASLQMLGGCKCCIECGWSVCG